MRATTLGPLRAGIASAIATGAVALLASTGSQAAVNAAPGAPAACSGVQITDAIGDGHHDNTDITAAWLTRASGHLQAVLVNRNGSWKPAHDDSLSAGWAVLWQHAGATRYVRLTATQDGALTYDAGTWTSGGGFASAGPTTGAVSAPGLNGWVAIDVPADAGGVDGARLISPFALTYDGVEGTDLHWVDRAPGGINPEGIEFGSDVVVGACPSAEPGPTAPGAPATAAPTLTAVSLTAPARLTGATPSAAITGAVTPAVAGITVTLVKTTPGRTVQRTATTDAVGTFAFRTPITERTELRATAGGLGSQTLTVDVTARVRIRLRRTPTGGAVVTGTVSPRLPGRVLWLRTDSVVPSATTRARGGNFTFRLAHPGRGRYQALFVPDHDRALRALSPTGVIR